MIDEPDPMLNNYHLSITIGSRFVEMSMMGALEHGSSLAQAILDYIPEEVRKELSIGISVAQGKTEKKKNSLLTLATYTPQQMEKIVCCEPFHVFMIGGDFYKAKVTSTRHRLFLINSNCVVCGLQGNLWLLQRELTSSNFSTAVLNLYGKDKDGKLVMLTQDHIIPKSKGGTNAIENLQTMCSRCNGIKGNDLISVEHLRQKVSDISFVKASITPPTKKEKKKKKEKAAATPKKGKIMEESIDNITAFKLSNLLTTQPNLRDLAQIPPMVAFVKKGGKFSLKNLNVWSHKNALPYNPPLIAISRFPDGVMMVHNGHHRAVAIVLGGREFLYTSEYIIKDFTYEEYMEINFDQRYVTPFDPRTHMRLGDFKKFKAHVMELQESNRDEAIAYIMDHPELYRADRDIHTIKELVERVRCHLEPEPEQKPADEEQCPTPKSLSTAIVESSTLMAT